MLDRIEKWSRNTCFVLHQKLSEILGLSIRKSKKISNDQELIQSDPISCPQNQKGNN